MGIEKENIIIERENRRIARAYHVAALRVRGTVVALRFFDYHSIGMPVVLLRAGMLN